MCRWRVSVIVALGALLAALSTQAQQAAGVAGRNETLPAGDLPALHAAITPADAHRGQASLRGVIADSSGALIPGAAVALRAGGGDGPVRSTVSDAGGRFQFVALPEGSYTLSAAAPGFLSAVAEVAGLGETENRELPGVVLAIPAAHADVYVTLDRHEIAAAEMHAALQQRIAGFPDFYTSFVWNAAPLDAGQKLLLGLHATTDRMAFVTAALVASGEQIQNTFPEFGGGPAGFGKRYGAAYADGFTGKFIGAALLPSLFRQDPRYFYMGEHGTVKERVRHAVISAFLARGDNGRLQPNYSHMLGNASAGAISTLYHPASNSAGTLALRNALLGTVGEAGVNVVRELFLKRFVRGGDPDANGMP
ncbi:MAG TPA: carboxypeptidase-like regulatory domain-containing protein [Terriglobales bacterium]|nr:carboxypeptidase-like regulatory domain-containing protein [Terriglobales bacterium]